MKLINKFLTVLAPVAATGIVVPAVVSCGCSGSTYEINYGDSVNCKDEKGENYHSLEDVKKAIQVKANKQERETMTESEFGNVIGSLMEMEPLVLAQMLYYDLIASNVLTDITIQLTDWDSELVSDPTPHYVYSFKLDGTEYGSKTERCVIGFEIIDDSQGNLDPNIYLAVQSTTGSTDDLYKIKSYMFYDCTVTPDEQENVYGR